MREFDTGATRNDDSDQLDYEGFISPFFLRTFAEYMHQHRFQADGTLRDSDNWQKGIPIESYLKSMIRHVMDVWIEFRGGESRDGLIDALCGVAFNTQGMIHELMSGGPVVEPEDVDMSYAMARWPEEAPLPEVNEDNG